MKKLFTLISLLIALSIKAQVSLTLLGSTASCTIPCNGTVQMSATGGTGPYTYVMLPSAQTNSTGSFTNVCAGSYTVTVADAVGGTATYIGSVGTIAAPTVINVVTTPINPPVNYQAQVNYTGGQAPFYISWYIMPSQTLIRRDTVYGLNDTISNLTPGDYSVAVTDSLNTVSGCQGLTAPMPFSICDPMVGSGMITVTPNDTVCSGQQITVTYIPLIMGPVQPLVMIFNSDNVLCNPSASNGTYSCNITQTTTFDGMWMYATGCAPILFPPLTVTVVPCTGLSEEELTDSFSMDPNPSTGEFTVNLGSYSGAAQMEIYDQSGRLVMIASVISGEKVKTDLPDGIYFTRFTAGEDVITKRISISR